jgi:hypothetical protein
MRKGILIAAGLIVLVAVLAGAAFVGARLLAGPGLPGLSSGPEVRIGQGGGPAYSDDRQPAKELPQTPADARGVFDHRQDNIIFVGTGKATFTTQKDQSGHVQISSSHDGPTVGVVVTPQTIVYKDVTLQQYIGKPHPNGKVQQVVEPGNLDDISTSSTITAWGKKTGDRIVADVLLYMVPVINGDPGAGGKGG